MDEKQKKVKKLSKEYERLTAENIFLKERHERLTAENIRLLQELEALKDEIKELEENSC
ncbi:MAG: hypothetical protein HXS48_03950 [Theionarchaea archaeon]|nr:hypothetical protein [Theionarchaea archaeon]